MAEKELRAPIEQAIEDSEPIEAITEEYARLKAEASAMWKKVKQLRNRIVARQEPGYKDRFVTLDERKTVDLKDARLWKVIEKEGHLEVATEKVLKAKKVEALAMINPKIKKAREDAMAPQVLVMLNDGDDEEEGSE